LRFSKPTDALTLAASQVQPPQVQLEAFNILSLLQSSSRFANTKSPNLVSNRFQLFSHLMASTNPVVRLRTVQILNTSARNGPSRPDPSTLPPEVAQLQNQDTNPLVRKTLSGLLSWLNTPTGSYPPPQPLDAQSLSNVFALLNSEMHDDALQAILTQFEAFPSPGLAEQLLDLLTATLANESLPSRQSDSPRIAATLQSSRLLTSPQQSPTSPSKSAGAHPSPFDERLTLAVLRGLRDPDGFVRAGFAPHLAQIIVPLPSDAPKAWISTLQNMLTADPLPQCRATAFLTLLEVALRETPQATKSRASTAILLALESASGESTLQDASTLAFPSFRIPPFVPNRNEPTRSPTPPELSPIPTAIAAKLTSSNALTRIAVTRLLHHVHAQLMPILNEPNIESSLRRAALNDPSPAVRTPVLLMLLNRPFRHSFPDSRRFGLRPDQPQPAPPDFDLILAGLNDPSPDVQVAVMQLLPSLSSQTQNSSRQIEIGDALYKAFTNAPTALRGQIAATLANVFPQANHPRSAELNRFWIDSLSLTNTNESALQQAVWQVRPPSLPSDRTNLIALLDELFSHPSPSVRASLYQKALMPNYQGVAPNPWPPERIPALVLQCLKDSSPIVRHVAFNQLGNPSPNSPSVLPANTPIPTLKSIIAQLETPTTDEDPQFKTPRLTLIARLKAQTADEAGTKASILELASLLGNHDPSGSAKQFFQSLAWTNPPSPAPKASKDILLESALNALNALLASTNNQARAASLELLNQFAMRDSENPEPRRQLVRSALSILNDSSPPTHSQALQIIQSHLHSVQDPKLIEEVFSLAESTVTNPKALHRSDLLQLLLNLPTHDQPAQEKLQSRIQSVLQTVLADDSIPLRAAALTGLPPHLHSLNGRQEQLRSFLPLIQKQTAIPELKSLAVSALATAHQLLGEPEQAIQLLESLRAIPNQEPAQPGIQPVDQQLSFLYEQSGQFEKAIQLLEAMRKQAPNQQGNPFFDRRLAALYKKTGRNTEAEAVLDQDSQPWSMRQRVFDAIRSKDFDSALRIAERLLRPQPNQPDDLVRLQMLDPLPAELARGSTNHLAKLTELVRLQLQLSPTSLALKRFLAACHTASNQTDEAIPLLEDLFKSQPNDQQISIRLASLYSQSSSSSDPDSLSKLRTISKANPDNHVLKFQLAKSLAQQGQITEARALAQELEALNPNPGPESDYASQIRFAIGDFKEALLHHEANDNTPPQRMAWMSPKWPRVRKALGLPDPNPDIDLNSPDAEMLIQQRLSLLGSTSQSIEQAVAWLQKLLGSPVPAIRKQSMLHVLKQPFYSHDRIDLWLQTLNAWSEKHPDESWFLMDQIFMLSNQQLPSPMLDLIQKMERQGSDNRFGPLTFHKARAYEMLDQIPQAIAALTNQPPQIQASPTTLSQLIGLHLRQGNTNAALSHYQNLKDSIPQQRPSPNTLWTVRELASVAIDLGDLPAITNLISSALDQPQDQRYGMSDFSMPNPLRAELLEFAGRHQEAEQENATFTPWFPNPQQNSALKSFSDHPQVPPLIFPDINGQPIDTTSWISPVTLVALETSFFDAPQRQWGQIESAWESLGSNVVRVVLLQTPQSDVGAARLCLLESQKPFQSGFPPKPLLDFFGPAENPMSLFLIDAQRRVRKRFSLYNQNSLIEVAREIALEHDLPPQASRSDLLQATTHTNAIVRNEAITRLLHHPQPLNLEESQRIAQKSNDRDLQLLRPHLARLALDSDQFETALSWASPNPNQPQTHQVLTPIAAQALRGLKRPKEAESLLLNLESNAIHAANSPYTSPASLARLSRFYAENALSPERTMLYATNAYTLAPGLPSTQVALARALLHNHLPSQALSNLVLGASFPIATLNQAEDAWHELLKLAKTDLVPASHWQNALSSLQQSASNTLGSRPIAQALLSGLFRARRDATTADQLWLQTGFIPNPSWSHLPISPPQDSTNLLDTAFIEETSKNLSTNVTSLTTANSTAWMASAADLTDGLTTTPSSPPNTLSEKVCYSLAILNHPTGGQALLKFGAHDRSRIWLNGQKILDQPYHRNRRLDQDQVPIHLKPGRNQILVKSVTKSNSRGFYLRITPP